MITSRNKSATSGSKPAPAAAGPRQTPAAPIPVATDAPKKRVKLVRDSVTMTRADFDLITVLKERALSRRRVAKKSELLRAGLHVLHALDDAALCNALAALTPLPVGRRKKTR